VIKHVETSVVATMLTLAEQHGYELWRSHGKK
jgi:hypothetical protein